MKLRKFQVFQGVIALPLLLALLSTVWFGLRWSRSTMAQPGEFTPVRTGATQAAAFEIEPMPPVAIWPAPHGQSRGEQWNFGLFTPPEILYDADRAMFVVRPAEIVTERSDADQPVSPPMPGWELLEVGEELYPLQLVGYVGGGADLLGTFIRIASGETLLLRQNARIDPPGFVLEQLVLLPEELPAEDTNLREIRVRAVVRDVYSGSKQELRQGVTALTGRRFARLQRPAEGAPPARWFEGEEFSVGDRRLRIEKIRLAPPAVDITNVNSDSNRVIRHTLYPVTEKTAP